MNELLREEECPFPDTPLGRDVVEEVDVELEDVVVGLDAYEFCCRGG